MSIRSVSVARCSILFAAVGSALGLTPLFAWGQIEEGSVSRGVIEEVVVTAMRRSQSIQDTPVSISALSSEALDDRGHTGHE